MHSTQVKPKTHNFGAKNKPCAVHGLFYFDFSSLFVNYQGQDAFQQKTKYPQNQAQQQDDRTKSTRFAVFRQFKHNKNHQRA